MSQKFIPLSVPNLKGNEKIYVDEAIETEWVSTGGKFVNDFEDKIANYVKSKGAVACQNGTAGLHLALRVCGVDRDSEVIVPTLTFIAAVNPIKYLGAEPIFMDCNDSLTMDTEKLEEFLKSECDYIDGKATNKKTKKEIKAIIVVHIFGNMVNMYEVMRIAKKYNIKVVEDATEAIGTYYLEGPNKGKYAGSIGDIGVYSFNGNKIITTGGGGMIVSNNLEYIKKLKHLSTQAKTDEVYYTHDEIGYNYRMTNVQAAMGIAQLERLEEFISKKEENYKEYSRGISEIEGLDFMKFDSDIRPNYWFYSLYINLDKYAMNRDELLKHLSDNKIQTRPIWGLIHEQKPYLNNQVYRIEKAKYYSERILNVPCSSNLETEDVRYICSKLQFK